MKIQKLGIFTLGLAISISSYGSAMVHLDQNRNLITVHGEIIFYGPQASEAVALVASNEIQTYWNGGTNATSASQYFFTPINGKNFQVVFEITHQVVSEEVAKVMIQASPSAEFNFIKMLQGVSANGDRSNMDGLGSNQGTWYLSDDLGLSTTTAHEFGHGLGLPHPNDFDWRGRGQPSLMCPRGTFVDAIYQWDPTSNAGASGGTMSPYKRKLIQWDIDNLQFSKLNYDSNGKAALNQPIGSSFKGRVY